VSASLYTSLIGDTFTSNIDNVNFHDEVHNAKEAALLALGASLTAIDDIFGASALSSFRVIANGDCGRIKVLQGRIRCSGSECVYSIRHCWGSSPDAFLDRLGMSGIAFWERHWGIIRGLTLSFVPFPSLVPEFWYLDAPDPCSLVPRRQYRKMSSNPDLEESFLLTTTSWKSLYRLAQRKCIKPAICR